MPNPGSIHPCKTRMYTQSNAQQNIDQDQLQNPTMGVAALATGGGGGGGLNAFYWHQIFALDSAIVEAQKMLSSHGGCPTIAMYHHRETI